MYKIMYAVEALFPYYAGRDRTTSYINTHWAFVGFVDRPEADFRVMIGRLR